MSNYNSKPRNQKLIAAPGLPKAAQPPDQLELDGCDWLDQYVEFSQTWSPRSFYGYHEAIGLWILSTIAARRITIRFGGKRYTNLYILLVGRTSLYAKTTAVKIAKDFLNELDLSYLLLHDECTPQRMVQEMSAKPPDGFQDFTEETKERILKELAFVGQRGWYYDEFGTNIQNMMKSSGPYSELRGLLKKLDDTERTHVKGTITRGRETIIRPYLALLGILTPADLAPYARHGSMLWGDGYFARMGLIVPSEGLINKDGRFPAGERKFDQNLINPISGWHKRLGVPEIQIAQGQILSDDNNRISNLELSHETQSAYYNYHRAVTDILEDLPHNDFDGNYSRFPEKALRISALFASLAGSNEIKINHWAKAQGITERWRSNLHSLYKQVNTHEFTSQKWTEEQKILKAVKEKAHPTSREIQQFTGLSSKEVTHVLEILIEENKVIRDASGKTIRYKLKEKPEQNVS